MYVTVILYTEKSLVSLDRYVIGDLLYECTCTYATYYIPQTGEELLECNHYASHEIEARMEDLNLHWQQLEEK